MKTSLLLLNTCLAVALFTTGISVRAQSATSCEKEIEATNQFLVKEGAAPIRDIADLANTLRTLEKKNTLPEKYINASQAKNLGWSGSDTETLWGIKNTNGKWIGGDRYAHQQLPQSTTWYSADVDVERGYRGYKRLIYNPTNQQRYLSTDNFHHFVELAPCQ